jgi:cell wall-associated protease
MLIDSAIPGNDYLKVSGTSQASPYVANVAAKIKTANMRLSPLEIKKILMGTVDKKAFLADKVMAGGIVNLDRAVVAANMTNSMSVNEAISRSKSQVKDAPTAVSSQALKNAVIPMDMPAMFR